MQGGEADRGHAGRTAEVAGVADSKPIPSWCLLGGGASSDATTVCGVGDSDAENEESVRTKERVSSVTCGHTEHGCHLW